MSTFLQLCQEARRECGIQGAGPTTVVSQTGLLQRVVDWVADADEYVQSLHHDWDFLWSSFSGVTASGSEDVTLAQPTDLGAWDRESFALNRGLATGRPLVVKPYKEWRQFNGVKSNQPPSSITIKPSGDLVLNSKADAVYTINADYWKTPTRMTVDASTSDIPVRYERIIICRAKMYFYEDQQLLDLYKAAEKEYQEWLALLRGDQLPGQHWRMQGEAELMAVRSL